MCCLLNFIRDDKINLGVPFFLSHSELSSRDMLKSAMKQVDGTIKSIDRAMKDISTMNEINIRIQLTSLLPKLADYYEALDPADDETGQRWIRQVRSIQLHLETLNRSPEYIIPKETDDMYFDTHGINLEVLSTPGDQLVAPYPKPNVRKTYQVMLSNLIAANNCLAITEDLFCKAQKEVDALKKDKGWKEKHTEETQEADTTFDVIDRVLICLKPALMRKQEKFTSLVSDKLGPVYTKVSVDMSRIWGHWIVEEMHEKNDAKDAKAAKDADENKDEKDEQDSERLDSYSFMLVAFDSTKHYMHKFLCNAEVLGLLEEFQDYLSTFIAIWCQINEVMSCSKDPNYQKWAHKSIGIDEKNKKEKKDEKDENKDTADEEVED